MITSGPSGPPERVSRLGALLDSGLRSDAPDSYAGLELIGATVVVYATGNGALVTATVREVETTSRSDTPVRVVAGMTNSLATLDHVRDQITARQPELRRRGIALTRWGPDIRSNRVGVGVHELTPESERLLESEFGADRIKVFESGFVYAAGSVGPSGSVRGAADRLAALLPAALVLVVLVGSRLRRAL